VAARRAGRACARGRSARRPRRFATGESVPSRRTGRRTSRSGAVELGLPPIEYDLTRTALARAVVDLSLVLVVSVLPTRERVLSPEQIDVDAIAYRRCGNTERLVKCVLPFVYEYLFAIEPHLMDIGDDLLEIDDLLLAVDYLLRISGVAHGPTITAIATSASGSASTPSPFGDNARAAEPSLASLSRPRSVPCAP
jgi:hypothetical protein